MASGPALSTTLALGTISGQTQPQGCTGPTDDLTASLCQDFQITCTQTQETGLASIRVTTPTGGSTEGTVVMTTGGGGIGAYASLSIFARELIIEPLVEDGYRIVELTFPGRWNRGIEDTDGPPAEEADWEGQANLACRVATMVDWIKDNVHSSGQPFCGTGQSGGASGLALTLTHYGMDDEWDALLLTGGPPHSKIAFGCDDDPPSCIPDGCYSTEDRCGIDWAYGNPITDCKDPDELEDSYGPCQEDPLDSDFIAFADEQSIVVDPNSEWDYAYPIPVYFIFGDEDTGSAPAQQEFYFDKLDQDITNDTQRDDVEETGHGVPKSQEGAQRIYDQLTTICVD